MKCLRDSNERFSVIFGLHVEAKADNLALASELSPPFGTVIARGLRSLRRMIDRTSSFVALSLGKVVWLSHNGVCSDVSFLASLARRLNGGQCV